MFQSLFSLFLFGLFAYGILLISLTLLPVVLFFACIAVIWYVWKMHTLRKNIEKTIRDQGDVSFNSAMRQSRRPDADGETIEVEYEVVEAKSEKKD